MQSYIITFYRRGGKKDPGPVIGTFADPAGGEELKFTSLAELHGLVEEAGAAWEREKRKKRRRNDEQ